MTAHSKVTGEAAVTAQSKVTNRTPVTAHSKVTNGHSDRTKQVHRQISSDRTQPVSNGHSDRKKQGPLWGTVTAESGVTDKAEVTAHSKVTNR